MSSNVNINVIVPTLTSFWATENADQLHRNLGCSETEGVGYTLGCYRGAADDGIIWHTTAQIPAVSYLSDPAESGIKFVQSGSAYRKYLFNGNFNCFTPRTAQSEGWQLDGSDPYDAARNHYFSEGKVLDMSDFDDPGLSFDNEAISADAGFVDDQFEVYVVYFTTNATNHDAAHPILQRILHLQGSSHPFAALRWRWGGQVIFNYLSNPSSLLYTLQSNAPTGSIYAVESDTTKSLAPSSEPLNWRPCDGTTVTTNPIDGSRFYVNDLYYDFLQRHPDEDGWNFWRSNITACGFSQSCISNKRVDVARAFFYSTEFIGYKPALASDQRGTHDYNSAFVFACYFGFLRRAPNDPPDNNWDGFNFWVNKLDSTNPDASDGKYNEMLRAFLESIEFRNRFVTH